MLQADSKAFDMRLPYFWKFQREVSRAARHLLRGPAYLLQYFVATPIYDRFAAKKQRVAVGGLPPRDRVAVYLIFPKDGVLRSHLRSIEYLVANGYMPLIVSNLPLTSGDREKLLAVCWKLIERPNVGYDFGGYRDAILSLEPQITRLGRLVLLNDSTWFPVPGAMNWLAEAEALDVDYAAAAWSGAVRRPNPAAFEQIEWKVTKTLRNFHYASFALSISPRILRDPQFMKFWQGFRLTEDKNRTVRRGEIGLTAWVIRHGYSHAATTEMDDLATTLENMSDSALRILLGRTIILNDPEISAIKKRIQTADANGTAARRQIEKLILMIAARRGVSYAMADYLVRHRGFMFLKKSPAALTDGTAEVLCELGHSLKGPFEAEILSEIDAMQPAPRAHDRAARPTVQPA